MNLPIEEYKKLMATSPICTVDVVFFDYDKRKILLVKRNNQPYKGEFFTIGGRLFKNEEFKDAAVRQSERELSIKIDKELLIHGDVINEIHPNSVFEGINYHTVNIFFGYILDESAIKEIKLDSQHSDFKWFDVDNKSFHELIKIRINTLLPKI